MIILGNGFTIDFLTHLNIGENIIDVSNLFRHGENVPWPVDDTPGFLSYKYCPNLWTLGARPFLNIDESNNLIEDIITCSNTYFTTWSLNKRDVFYTNNSPIYIRANAELVAYLYSLFIYYDNKLDFDEINLDDWSWGKYFKQLSLDETINNVSIVTLNYDIWLEKVLMKLGIEFNISCFDNKNTKFQIYKPHGSISFQHKSKSDCTAYNIEVSDPTPDLKIADFNVCYTDLEDYKSICAIIPPAGDSNRLTYEWSKCIKDEIKEKARQLEKRDELIICGLSYWPVDRLEIDSMLTEIPPELDCVKLVNPRPNRSLNAVITTLFKNVIFYTSCNNLGD
ncbi:hypothetical protein [Methanimicrococcus blatticola]|uniref:SIR2-like protein n=1 Tax=Methanimicrococcus blatticola TaxID=91560 RepID=A0A484F4J1_9EURY|nr:hypothetical protein [Methanimicrococcus blatticola]MBZ3935450.1 hypothetical protein [Methanimicrococcus blatticola]MCC2509094.1 hypothetical protein [Methanimicrococcus blatticola]TDQ69536.1 hypothetical protein C7391_0870 [Methanimicrococcus blatticola]